MILGLNISFNIVMPFRIVLIENPYPLYNRVYMDAQQAESPYDQRR
jgi:hypothetical protein